MINQQKSKMISTGVVLEVKYLCDQEERLDGSGKRFVIHLCRHNGEPDECKVFTAGRRVRSWLSIATACSNLPIPDIENFLEGPPVLPGLVKKWEQLGKKWGQLGKKWGQVGKKCGEVGKKWGQVGNKWGKVGNKWGY